MTCALGSLADGQSATVVILAVPQTAGSLPNLAAKADPPDASPGDETGTTTTLVQGGGAAVPALSTPMLGLLAMALAAVALLLLRRAF